MIDCICNIQLDMDEGCDVNMEMDDGDEYNLNVSGVKSVNGKVGKVVLDAGDFAYDDTKEYSTGSVGAELKELSQKEIDVDSALSDTSTNPVQNKVINAKTTDIEHDLTIGDLAFSKVSIPVVRPSDWLEKGVNTTTGELINSYLVRVTRFFPIDDTCDYKFTGVVRKEGESTNRVYFNYFYDKDKNFIGRSTSVIVENAKFVRFGYGFNSSSDITVDDYGFENLIADWSAEFTPSYIKKENETEEKLQVLNDNKADVIISTASGSIAHFEDGAEADAKSVIAHIEPVQEGSGVPSPDNVRPISGWTGCNVTRTGKNLLSTSSISLNRDTERVRSIRIDTIPPGTYIFSWDYAGTATDANVNFRTAGNVTAGQIQIKVSSASPKTITFTKPYSAIYSFIAMAQESGVTAEISNMMIRSVSDTDDIYESYQGETCHSTFPTEAGTVYGGYVDVTNGKLVVDRANIASYSGQTLPGEWISDRDVYTPGGTPTTGAQVVYKLAEPVVYNITPQQITTLLGTNNVWHDANGETEVEYRADTKLYIEQLTKPTEDDMTANANIASGKFFMVGNRLFLSTSAIASGDTINPGTNCTELSLADALNNLN